MSRFTEERLEQSIIELLEFEGYKHVPGYYMRGERKTDTRSFLAHQTDA